MRKLSLNPMRKYMRAKLETPTGKKIYARRKWTVEPVFGQIKEARRFRRFSLRGRVKVLASTSSDGWAAVSRRAG